MHDTPDHPRHQTGPRALGPQSLDPLPADFDRDLLEIDTLLQRHAARTSVPRHLADAVYDVTVGLLWKRHAPLSIHGAAGRVMQHTAWSRVSMAAAVAMAFVVAGMFMQVPMTAADAPMVSGVLPTDVEGVLFEPVTGTGDVWYLLETRDATFDDLEGDVHDLLQELEL